MNFDDVLVNIKDVATTAKEKIEDGMDLAKLKANQVKVSSDIKKAYQELGQKYYASIKDTKLQEDYASSVEKLDTLNQLLISINEQIMNCKNLKKCTICDTAVQKDSQFCPNCGSKF